MGDLIIHCPLCCNQTFNSKNDLIEHITNVLSNLTCPICQDKLETLDHLKTHLTHDECQEVNLEGNTCEKDVIYYKHEENVEIDGQDNIEEIDTTNPLSHNGKVDTNENSVYVELLDEIKQTPRGQELRLVKDSSDRYMIVTDDVSLLNSGSTVVKQNNDGTISMTVEEPKVEAIVDNQTEVVDDGSDQVSEGLYSCNTCGVSFSSVLEHIQTYHNDQEVVVEEQLDSNMTLEYENTDENTDENNLRQVDNDKQGSRRMITDTGVIVETPSEPSVTNEVRKKKIDKNVPYHRVVIKEMETAIGNKIKFYKCTLCNVHVSVLSEFKNRPCKALRYPCLLCPVAYDNQKSLSAHMKVHKTKPVKYPCMICPVAYDNLKSLTAHMKVHKARLDELNIVDIPTTFVCNICSTVFPTRKSLKLHKRMHDPVKSRPIEPPVQTLEGNTGSEQKYVCSVCFKLIPEDYREIHENSHVNPSNKVNCDICNKKFQSMQDLKMHMNVHNIDKVFSGKEDTSLPYKCLYCNRKFARPHEKVKHERIHTGEKPHTCEICGKSFRVSYCLTLHMRTHTGARPYTCPQCGKRFKAHSVYNHHLLTHSEVRAYKCPLCPKAFKTSVQLAGHKNSHTKPFSCTQCNRPFASLYAVRLHTEVHLRENILKFSCSLCGASYARAFALKDHIKQAHKDAVDNNLIDVKNDWSMRVQDGDADDDLVVIGLDNQLSQEV
ncbi:Zinc finger protein 595 [Papilio xuthus]|uniref:Zinc finger protein 595 n=1 Tax=Papilio xuthus TaxID=66420 RepID=A0A194PVD0_PAPXU|nr:Zinc finger protein 595 [Papilio xuthus]